jgi:hypothetical protein
MTGAQFEISVGGVPRTYRDQKDFALLAAQILKSKKFPQCGQAERLEDRGREPTLPAVDETPLGGPSGMLVQDQPRC